MSPNLFDTASGDLLADRRADYAEMLMAEGDFAAASELMLGALELAPQWSFGWFRLGEMHEAAGQMKAAVRAWRTALELDRQDRAGAALKLALAGAAPAPDAPPSAFVETLFDQYAKRFDTALVEDLGYRVPELLFDVIRAQAGPEKKFIRAIDLGCGTGLMGKRLRQVVEKLAGYDLSAEMLREARKKGVYDRLDKADLQDLPFPPAFDGEEAALIIAADVFMYLGRLDRVFAGVAEMLAPGGLFAFSVEKHDGPGDFSLRETRRYAHSQGYVRGLLEANGFEMRSLETEIIRQDRNSPVEGFIALGVSRSS
ncbi:MAG TPA: methyltransferase domain-containing protein [Mesorhizobium sp.]|jgi:predicted TPR repeat methyltransferase|nr:methyltransferase domain-containing protein [Mesorhizobium sp.]